jgi:hypothetical protein
VLNMFKISLTSGASFFNEDGSWKYEWQYACRALVASY